MKAEKPKLIMCGYSACKAVAKYKLKTGRNISNLCERHYDKICKALPGTGFSTTPIEQPKA
jgi:hypothetical protein